MLIREGEGTVGTGCATEHAHKYMYVAPCSHKIFQVGCPRSQRMHALFGGEGFELKMLRVLTIFLTTSLKSSVIWQAHKFYEHAHHDM